MYRYLQFLKKNSAVLSFGFLAVFWGNFGQSFVIAWFGADIQQSLGLSAGQYGLAYSFATLCSAMTLVSAGSLIDCMDLRKYVLIIATGLTLASVVMSNVTGIFTLVVGLYLLRLFGQGLLPHTGQTVMVKYFTFDRGKALSIATSGVPVGEIVLPLLVVFLISTFGWQHSWLFVAFLTPVFFVPVVLWLLSQMKRRKDLESVEERITSIEPREKKFEVDSVGRKEMLADRRFWLILPAILTPPFVITGILIQQGFVLEEKAWSSTWFATSFIFYGATHWVGSLLFGWLVDLFTGRRLVGLYLLPMSLGFLLLMLCSNLWVAPVFMALIGISMGASGPVVGSLWAELYGTAHMGAIRSLITAFIVFASSLSPVLFGLLIDNGGTLTQLLQMICALFVGAILLAIIGSRPDKNVVLVG